MMNSMKSRSLAKTLRAVNVIPKGAAAIGLTLCVVSFIALAFPASSLADTVSGRIYGQDGKPVAAMTFAAKPAKGDTVEFKTNGSGSFSVYLDPGRYTISPTSDPGLQGVVDSLPQPVQQDIHLKKGG